MDLDVFDAREPVLVGDRVLTSAASTDYPAGLPVGEVLADASPESTSLSTTVRPFVDAESLRFVVVLAWPPDPVTAATDDTVPEDTTGTTLDEGATTTTPTTPEGDG
jgi:cell shape-determining protein MreC